MAMAMLSLWRIPLVSSACLLTVGVSLVWGGQGQEQSAPSSKPDGPSIASQPQPSHHHQSSTAPAQRVADEKAPTHQAITEGATSSRGGAVVVVEPISLKDVSVDSDGMVRVRSRIEAHPTGYVRVHELKVDFVKETPAAGAGYVVRTPKLNMLADGRVEQQHEEILRLHGGLYDPNNLGTPVPFEHPHSAPGGGVKWGEGFEWDGGEILLNTILEGEVAYGGRHHGFSATANNGGEISYAAKEGGPSGDVAFSINPHSAGGSVVSGPHAFEAHLVESGSVEYKGSKNNNINGGGGDSFELRSSRLPLETHGSYAGCGIASGRHAFGASLSNGGRVEYRSGVSFSVHPTYASTVVSGAHGFAAHLRNGGKASYEMVDNSFELSAANAYGEVYSLRHHHFSAKLTNGGRIEHRAELGDFSVEAMADGEVTYGGVGGGRAGHGGEDEKKKKTLRVQLTRGPEWPLYPPRTSERKRVKTGSITHNPKTGFFVQVNGPSTVTLSDAVTGKQQHAVQFEGAGTVRFDSSGEGIKATEKVEK